MARKATDSNSAHNFDDIIGFALLAAAVLLLVAQLSFDHNDISFLTTHVNKPTHNWIGPFGAYLGWAIFLPLGLVGYIVPVLLAAFGASYLLSFLTYLRERLSWSLLWAAVLLVSLTGLLHIMDNAGWFGRLHEKIGNHSTGGWLGFVTYEYGFWMLGAAGAPIVYAALCFISLLFLTGFQLGAWLTALWTGRQPASDGPGAEEKTLERRARELQKEARKLQEEVERTGLGADLQPVPEPTVRDLSVPQAKPARTKKTAEPANEPAPAVAAATASDVLGKKSEDESKSASVKTEEPVPGKMDAEKSVSQKGEPEVRISGLPGARPKPARKKPITVAATPLIGNYQLPSLDFLQHPDMTIKPTESKDELMANARLMQQTLAQF